MRSIPVNNHKVHFGHRRTHLLDVMEMTSTTPWWTDSNHARSRPDGPLQREVSMRTKRWSIVAVVALAVLFLGGYAMVAWTAPVVTPSSRAALPTGQTAGSGVVNILSEQPSVCAPVAAPGVNAVRPPGSDMACGNLCSSDAQCSQAPPCCSTNVCAFTEPRRCTCE
jgi:hypothetical protein